MTNQAAIDTLTAYIAAPNTQNLPKEVIEACTVAISVITRTQIPVKVIAVNKSGEPAKRGDYAYYKCPTYGNEVCNGFHYPPYGYPRNTIKACNKCLQALSWETDNKGGQQDD